MKARSLSILAGLVLALCGGSTARAQSFSDCGVLVQGVSCVLFQADSGGLYLLSNLGGHQVGDQIFVTGTLDPGCITICLQGDGCIDNNTVDVCAPPAPDFRRGDCNADAELNIADAIYLLGGLFPGPGGPNVLECQDACDANDDGELNIADAIALLNSLFGSPTVPLPAPSMSCGTDPTTDMLDCPSFAGCP